MSQAEKILAFVKRLDVIHEQRKSDRAENRESL
jgi:hypothetical protein